MDVDVDPAIFAQVHQELLLNGAVPVLHYLNDLTLLHTIASMSSGPPPPQPIITQENEPNIPKAVARIHQACQQTFGSTHPLKFDFEEDAVTHGTFAATCTLFPT